MFATPFAFGCIGIVWFAILFHWSTASPFVCFFMLWPAFAWFALLLALLLSGIVGVRKCWFLCGCLLWLIGLGMTEDAIQWFKFYPGRAHQRFTDAQFAARSYLTCVAKPEQVDVPLRVVTWNLFLGQLGSGDEVVRTLAELDPDIVFLQEYRGSIYDKAIKSSPVLGEFHLLRAHRTVISSRFPATLLPDVDFKRVSAYEVEVSPGVKVTCISVHLKRILLSARPRFRSWGDGRLAHGIELCRRQLEAVREAIDRHREWPLIVAGDFNLPPHYPDLRFLARDLKDCFDANGYGWGKTVPTKWRKRPFPPVMRIDMIWAPADATVFHTRAVATSASDHALVVAEISIPVTVRPASASLTPRPRL